MRLWQIYHENIPEFLLEFASVDPMLRLKNIGMNCGLEYTSFPVYRAAAPYTRYEHSVGTALIIWHFTQDKKQTVAGLFHDISTPVFAHVVDFLHHDYLKQESTEAKTKELISGSEQIRKLLKQHELAVEEVCDYHQYPVADNDPPRLSADRLEYTLGNFLNYQGWSLKDVEACYRDLTVVKDENGIDEIAFRTKESAIAFTKAALANSRIYVADADRYAMQYLSDILRSALDNGVLADGDLYTTESQVIGKLKRCEVTAVRWAEYRGFSEIERRDEDPGLPLWMSIPAKKRYIDPLIAGEGRVAAIDMKLRTDIDEFLSNDFQYWICAT